MFTRCLVGPHQGHHVLQTHLAVVCRNKDKDWSCNVWAKQGECQRNARYMKPNCARACGICGDALGADKGIKKIV